MSETMILADDPIAATEIAPGWWKPLGCDVAYRDEQFARTMASTHRRCGGRVNDGKEPCREFIGRGRSFCDACRERNELDRYMKRPAVEYTGGPFFIDALDGDSGFCMTLEDALDLESVGGDICELINLRPVTAEPIVIRQIDLEDIWSDFSMEDFEYPDWLSEAVEKLNATIRENAGHSNYYEAGKERLLFGDGPTSEADK